MKEPAIFASSKYSQNWGTFPAGKRNRWYDFGIGKGGNIIDLVCLLSNCNVAEALHFLSDEFPIYSFQGPINDTSETESSNTILKVKSITKSYLKKYVSSRGISLEIARNYCKEVWYECREKSYYAIGLQNKNGAGNFVVSILKLPVLLKAIPTFKMEMITWLSVKECLTYYLLLKFILRN